MNSIHKTNISYLDNFIQKSEFDWIDYTKEVKISYFKSGGGTHLYLIQNGTQKFLARINFFPGKNDWKVKRTEFEVLKEIEPLRISPKAFLLNEENELHQDFTIVEFIEGENVLPFSDEDIALLAHDFKKLHSFPHKFRIEEELPYKCSIFDEFANGDDKKIENYDFPEIEQVFEKYNSLKHMLGKWFNSLNIFDGCSHLCLCHGDLKSENILKTNTGVMLIDWECAGIDIPETDIARLFSGCVFNKVQEELFLQNYYDHMPNTEILERISAVKIVLDFFRILEDYCIHKRKRFEASKMLYEIIQIQTQLDILKK